MDNNELDMYEEQEKIMIYCATTNPAGFNKDKALEESAEFFEAVLKNVTKHPDNPKRPTRDDILDEYADFMYRGMIYLKELFPELTLDDLSDKVGERVETKLNQLIEWKNKGMYKGGL